MQKVSLIHGSSLIILHTVICFACRFRWRLSQLFYNVFWAMLSCWWRFDFFKYLKRWITSRGCWKKWWDNVHGPFCKLHWNHYPPPPHSTSAPYIPTMWPYYYHGYFNLSSYSATTVSNGAILAKLTIRITREQQYIPRKLAVGQSAVRKKTISYCQHKI